MTGLLPPEGARAELGIVAVDAATSSGWTILLDGEIVASGQCNINALFAELAPYADYRGEYAEQWVLAVEMPFVGPNQSKHGVIRHAMNCGRVLGWIETMWPNQLLWVPRATEWRKIIGPWMPRTKVKAKRAALEIARAAGLPCEGKRGGALDDQAESFCIALAAGLWFYATQRRRKPLKIRNEHD